MYACMGCVYACSVHVCMCQARVDVYESRNAAHPRVNRTALAELERDAEQQMLSPDAGAQFVTKAACRRLLPPVAHDAHPLSWQLGASRLPLG